MNNDFSIVLVSFIILHNFIHLYYQRTFNNHKQLVCSSQSSDGGIAMVFMVFSGHSKIGTLFIIHASIDSEWSKTTKCFFY